MEREKKRDRRYRENEGAKENTRERKKEVKKERMERGKRKKDELTSRLVCTQ